MLELEFFLVTRRRLLLSGEIVILVEGPADPSCVEVSSGFCSTDPPDIWLLFLKKCCNNAEYFYTEELTH